VQIDRSSVAARRLKRGGELLYFAHSVGIDGKATSALPHETEVSSFDQATEKAFGEGVVKDPSRGSLVGTISQIDAEGRRKFRQYFRPRTTSREPSRRAVEHLQSQTAIAQQIRLGGNAIAGYRPVQS
jgi:hypothetical protein